MQTNNKSKSNISRFVLPNGLTVLIKEMKDSPVVAMDVWVKVGSLNEHDEIAGVSHFVEHLLFKGTGKRNTEEITDEIKAVGGYFDASTGYENTSYNIVVPAQHFDTALDVAVDCIMCSVFPIDEFEREREVILEEIKYHNDVPMSFAFEQLMNLAYKRHYYRRSITGYPETISKITREQVIQYYKNYYQPNNITFVLAGGIDTNYVKKKIEKAWRSFPKKRINRHLPPKEPLQRDFRFKHIEGDLSTTYLLMGYKVPGGIDFDHYSVQFLNALLSWGRSAILETEVKEKLKLVNSISCSTIYDVGGINEESFFIVDAILDVENLEPAQRAILQTLESIKKGRFSEVDMKKDLSMLESGYLFAQETPQGQVQMISYAEALGDYTLAERFVDEVNKVTKDDIVKVANKYLGINSCSMLVYAPQNKSSQRNINADELQKRIYPEQKQETRNKKQETRNKKVEKIVLDNGLTVLLKENRNVPIISLDILIKYGVKYETDDNNGISLLTQQVLSKSTKYRNAKMLAESLESIGTVFGSSVSKELIGCYINSPKKYFQNGYEILMEILNEPAFDPEEIDKERKILIAEIEENEDDIYYSCNKLLKELLYGNHPYGKPNEGTKKSLMKLSRDDLIKWYKNYYSPDQMVVAVFGDIDKAQIVDIISDTLGKLTPHKVIKKSIPPVKKIKGIIEKTKRRDKKQTNIMFGFFAPNIFDKDYYSMIVLSNILSGYGGGRLFNELRGKESLAYDVSADYKTNIEIGTFRCYIGTSPQKESQARESILRELRKIKEAPVSHKELSLAKNFITGVYKISMQRNSAQASEYALREAQGIGYSAVDRFISGISAVTIKDVLEVANKYIDLENYAVAVIRGKKNG